jgi:hypothetical protein
LSLEYVGSILYSKANKFYEENNTVYHAKFPEQNFQQLPALPDAVACQFSTLEKLGECTVLIVAFNLLLHCVLTYSSFFTLQWSFTEIIASTSGTSMM